MRMNERDEVLVVGQSLLIRVREHEYAYDTRMRWVVRVWEGGCNGRVSGRVSGCASGRVRPYFVRDHRRMGLRHTRMDWQCLIFCILLCSPVFQQNCEVRRCLMC